MIKVQVPLSNATALREVADLFNRLAEHATTTGVLREAIDTPAPGINTIHPPVPPAPPQAAIDPMAAIAASVTGTDPDAGIPAPPQPAAAPPAPPQPAAAPPAPGVELDSESLPWDKRIHAGTKTKRQGDNTWKLIKGVDKNYVEQVKAELRQTMALAVPQPAVTPAPVTPAPVTPAPPVLPAPPVQNTGLPTPTTFPELVQAITQMQTADKITHMEITAEVQKLGLANLALIANRPDLIPALYVALSAIWSTR